MSFRNSTRGCLFALLCGALSAGWMALPATAQTVSPAGRTGGTVSVTLAQFKVVRSADGADRLIDVSSFQPGDVVEYRATYANHTGRTVTGLVADLPIPQGLVYVPRSAKPGGSHVTAAANDAVFAVEPLVRRAAPTQVAQPLPYADYRTLRWRLGQLLPDGATTVTARAMVATSIAVP